MRVYLVIEDEIGGPAEYAQVVVGAFTSEEAAQACCDAKWRELCEEMDEDPATFAETGDFGSDYFKSWYVDSHEVAE